MTLTAVIPDDYVDTICKPGEMGETCAFLTMNPRVAPGFMCAKRTVVEPAIRARLAEGTMNAKGDNCEGWPE